MAPTKAIEYLERHGRIEAIDGAVEVTAAGWLEAARRELPGVRTVLDAGHARLAFNAAYDVYRHAAEAVVLGAGYRMTNTSGAHEATLVAAHSLLAGESGSPFEAPSAIRFRTARHQLEYVDPGRPVEVSVAEAEWALQTAAAAVESVEAALAR